jgi:hypothetical protein
VALNDLDRLNPFEALEMVSGVKNLADLSNVIYLLSYNEVWFDHLIGEIIKTDGHSFWKIYDLSRLPDFDLDALVPPLSEEDKGRLQYAWHEY